jgi:hypothetical protein
MPPAAPSIATLLSGLDSVDEYDRPTRCLDVHGLNAAREDLNTAAFILQKEKEWNRMRVVEEKTSFTVRNL